VGVSDHPPALAPLHQLRFVVAQQHQVVDVTCVPTTTQLTLGELVDLVEVDVGPELTRQVADRQTALVATIEQALLRRHRVLRGPRRRHPPALPMKGVVLRRVVQEDDFGQPQDLGITQTAP